MELHRRLGISYNAAWYMHHKLMQVILERDHTYPLGGMNQLDDASLGTQRRGSKRCRGAGAKAPFVATAETTKSGALSRIKLSFVKGFRKPEIR